MTTSFRPCCHIPAFATTDFSATEAITTPKLPINTTICVRVHPSMKSSACTPTSPAAGMPPLSRSCLSAFLLLLHQPLDLILVMQCRFIRERGGRQSDYYDTFQVSFSLSFTLSFTCPLTASCLNEMPVLTRVIPFLLPFFSS